MNFLELYCFFSLFLIVFMFFCKKVFDKMV